jgi:hypothetical protein
MDHHTVAEVSIAGSCLDVLGSLYLAYDLLGGQHGPLRTLTRAVTYSIVFGIGYGLGLGVLFGIASGTATGITVALELSRTARRQDHYSLFWESVFSAIRGVAFGIALYALVGYRFAAAFAILITGGQIFAYSRGIRPGFDYDGVSRRPRLTRKQFTAAVVRTVGYIATALACSAFVQHLEHPWAFALRVGIVTGIVTAVGNALGPFIEYFSENLPERRMGAFGILLIFIGFSLQSLQYWLVVWDVPLK